MGILQSIVVWLIQSIWSGAISVRKRWERWRVRRMRPDTLSRWRARELERVHQQAVELAAFQSDEDLCKRGRTRADAVRRYEVLVRSQRGVEMSQFLLDDMDVRGLDLSGIREGALNQQQVERANGDGATVLPAGLDVPPAWRAPASVADSRPALPDALQSLPRDEIDSASRSNRAIRCLIDSGEPVVLRRSRWRAVVCVVIYGLFALIGGGIGYGALSYGGRSIVVGVLFAWLGLLGVVGVFRFGRDALSPRDLLWINDDGLKQHVGFPHVSVLWSEIADVSCVERTGVKTVAVTVRNPEVLPRRYVVMAKALGSRVSVRAVAAVALLVDLVTVRWTDVPDDVTRLATADAALRGNFEISTRAFPVKAQYLATVLQDRQRAYTGGAKAATTPTSPAAGAAG